MNSISQRERAYSQNQSAELILNEFNALQFRMIESSHGDLYPTTYCELIDHNGTTLQDGMGKGVGLQAILSARFEALEHTITDLTHGLVTGVWQGSIQDAKELNYKIICNSLPSYEDPKTLSLSGYWKTFSSSKHAGTFIYPLSKLDPFSNYPKIYTDDELYKELITFDTPWLKNNNGSAIGATQDDAFLHAYNEAIERYSLSSLYVDCFLKENTRPVTLINKNSLPDDLKRMISTIETENGVILDIIAMTSELGVPSFTVKAYCSKKLPQALGYGTSLYADYALQRALLECQQLLHTRHHPIYGPLNLQERKTVGERLESWPKVKSAVNIDLEKCQTSELDFPNNHQIEISVAEQKQYLEDLFHKHDIEVFSAVTYKSKVNSICAVRILIPDFSDFSFIEAGLPVTPSGRVLRRFFEDL